MAANSMISIQPTETECVIIRHREWDAHWQLQFPEMIIANDVVVKFMAPLNPAWRRDGEQEWSYEWRPDDIYLEAHRPSVPRDKSGQPLYPLRGGLLLRAAIAVERDQAVALKLTLSNETDQLLNDVMSDGGCFGARSPSFNAWDVVQRSYIWTDGRMVSMGALDRTKARLCAYQADPLGYERPIEKRCEDFWGRSTARIGEPAVLGAVSVDGAHAVAFGYEGSRSALANGKGKACLHSRPEFGAIAPGQSVTRRGCIFFGDDLEYLASQLRRRLLK